MRRRTTSGDGLHARLLAAQRANRRNLAGRLGVDRLGPDLDDDAPIEVHAWQLPGRPADYGLTPSQRVTVHVDGRIEVPDTGPGPIAPPIDLASHRSPNREKNTHG